MKTVIELPELMRFSYQRKSYRIHSWDLQENPFLVFWARAQSEPELLVKELVEGDLDPAMKEEVGICLRRCPTDILSGTMSNLVLRHVAVSLWGFAVPDRIALGIIQKHSPEGVVEIGAGSGYWAKLLRILRVPVAAYDSRTGTYQHGFKFGSHSEVEIATHEKALAGGAHREKTLLLSWPDYDESWPNETLSLYKGNTLVYIGEWGGCTGDRKFHETLDQGWETVKEYQVPTWWGLHESLYVLKRKT